ncbi:MAG: response regulator transcription factor [Aquificaceae bacterium]|nr:response regulator transcription factor [Aquificaceae bacterium]MDW8237119.1 response regulator transcription factor [Aquificaceae bacterium]
MKVLLVEDDGLLGNSLKEYLKTQGIVADWINDSREFFDLLEVSTYDVIVMDLTMPHLNGEELLSKLREKGDLTPVLILTAKSRLEDKENCFSLGADDFLTKPFEPKELLLRIRALHRRVFREEIIKIGDVCLNISAKRAFVKEKELKLSMREWMILKLLAQRRGSFVSTEEILNYVWGDELVGEEVVRTYIKNLRKLLPEGFIKSQKGRGYKVDE